MEKGLALRMGEDCARPSSLSVPLRLPAELLLLAAPAGGDMSSALARAAVVDASALLSVAVVGPSCSSPVVMRA